ncbi:hypothetical protein TNCV_3059351 [Trichonephila clavipes]|nr:hypothetical protein TNCV_3059351 [Trichonephila clavipes]
MEPIVRPPDKKPVQWKRVDVSTELSSAHNAKTIQLWLKENVQDLPEQKDWPSSHPDLNALDINLCSVTTAVALGKIYKSCYPQRSPRDALLAVVSDNNPITQDVLDCRHDLKILSSLGKTIVHQWIPAHCEIPGNEKADCLAKKGVLVM